MAEQKKIKPMTIAECQVETIKHIDRVRYYIRIFTDKLTTRGVEHDKTKLESPEVELFAEHTPKLANLTYGTEEYRQSLNELGVALQHHYANVKGRHHPEHFKRGINDMNLVDIVEFFCDIKAASERQHDGNLLKSIESCAERFAIDDQLKQILINTAKMIDEQC